MVVEPGKAWLCEVYCLESKLNFVKNKGSFRFGIVNLDQAMKPTKVTQLGAERLEKRMLTAADLVDSLPVDAGGSLSVSIGQFCTPFAASGSGETTNPVPQIGKIYEQAESNSHLDVDRDGYITPSDAQLVLQHLNRDELSGPIQANQTTDTNETSIDLDVNRDGIVSPTDALMVMNRVHSYTSLVPCTCSSCVATLVVDGSAD